MLWVMKKVSRTLDVASMWHMEKEIGTTGN